MNKNKKIILGFLIGIPLFIGLIIASLAQNSNVKSAATSRDTHTTISQIKSTTITIAKPTIKPTVIPKLTSTFVQTKYIAPTVTYVQPTTPSNSSSGLSNDNYYTNSDGNQVHSPAYSTNNSVPEGATAQCADGTYSFSLHRRGTCSYHGGVVTWY